MLANLSYKSIVSIVYLIALMMEVIDVTIVNVALPQIQNTLHVPVHLMGWITNGYVLSLATTIPISSWLGDRYGSKKIFLFGIFLFTLASILCGFSKDISFLILSRVLQGMGGGMLVPVGQTILYRAFESWEIPALLSKLSIPLTLAPALGQTLGGVIVEYFQWHWIFWVNIPFGIFCLSMTQKYLAESEKVEKPLDFFGLIFCSLAVFCLFYCFSSIDFQSSFTKPILFFIAFCIFLIIFILYEKKKTDPFFNLKILSYPNFRLSLVTSLLSFSNIIGTFFISNFVFQETIGWSPLQAGIMSIPFPFGFLTASKSLPHLYPRKIGTIPLLMIANGICVLTALCMNFVHNQEQFYLILCLNFFRGIGFGYLIIVLQSAGLMGIKKEHIGDASTIVTLTRYSNIGFGTAFFIVLTVVFMNFYQISPVSFSSNPKAVIQIFHWLFNISTFFLMISFFFIRKFRVLDASTPCVKSQE